MALNLSQLKRAAPKARAYYLNDGGGLYFCVYPSGARSWVFRYRDAAKRDKMATIGDFPAVSLAEARAARDVMRARVKKGLPPKDAPAQAATFGDVAKKWHEQRTAGGELAPRHLATVAQRLNAYLLPAIGARPLADIRRAELVELVQALAARGTVETAHRAAGILAQIFAFAADLGIIERGGEQVAASLSRILPAAKKKHFATTSQPAEIGAIMRAINAYSGGRTVKAALLFVAYTMTRSGETRAARWQEIDTAAALWTIPAEHMKRRRVHKVPLSRQALRILEQVRPWTYNGPNSLIFRRTDEQKRGRANTHGGMLSDFALLRPLQLAAENGGGAVPKITVHGFRSMASTVLNGLRWDKEIIEMQLSHLDADRVRAIYNHAERLDERRELLQFWADWLDAQRDGRAALSPVEFTALTVFDRGGKRETA